MISAPGVGSGLDIGNIIRQLMQIERQPLNQLDRQESAYKATLSAYGQLSSALSGFQDSMAKLGDVGKFQVFSATSSAEGVFTASASSSASAGSYTVEVERLAQAHKVASNAYDPAELFSAGDLTIASDSGFDAFTVSVAADSTLEQIRDQINNAADNSGVTASIINVSGGSRLVLTSNETGAENVFTVTGSGGVSGIAAELTQDPSGDPALNANLIQGGTDALVRVDGFEVTSSTNAISGVMDGVTLTLVSAEPGQLHTLTVGRDTDSIKESVQAFVDAYNSLRKTMGSLREGQLEADPVLLTIESRMRNVFNTPANLADTDFKYLAEIGISFQKSGDLALDESRFDQAMASDLGGVAQLFGHATEGYAARLSTLAGNLLGSEGPIEARRTGINSSIRQLDTQRERMEIRLEHIEARYRAQFTALDALVGQMNSTSAYLANQLAMLPRFG